MIEKLSCTADKIDGFCEQMLLILKLEQRDDHFLDIKKFVTFHDFILQQEMMKCMFLFLDYFLTDVFELCSNLQSREEQLQGNRVLLLVNLDRPECLLPFLKVVDQPQFFFLLETFLFGR